MTKGIKHHSELGQGATNTANGYLGIDRAIFSLGAILGDWRLGRNGGMKTYRSGVLCGMCHAQKTPKGRPEKKTGGGCGED